MRERLPALIVIAVAIGLLIAGCGGDGDDETAGSDAASAARTNMDSDSEASPEEGDDESADGGGSQTISKRAFLKQGNAICQATVTRVTSQILPPLEKQESEGGSNRKAVEVELVETVAVPELRTELEQLEELGAPPGDESKVAQILGAINDLIAEAEADPTVFVGTNKAFEGPAGLAERYGLKSCPYG